MMQTFAAAVVLTAVGALEAPVTEATVYGDRARVVRTATVEVNGEMAVDLPLLEESVELDSLRVEAEGATVKRVEIQRASPEDFPETEARKLLTELEKLDDALHRAQGEREAASAQLDRMRGLGPQRPPAEQLQPRPDLDPSGWNTSLQFIGDRSAALEARVRDADQKLLNLNQERQKVEQRAQLLGAERVNAGWRVTAHVEGKGRAKLRLIYVVPRARWAPLYELQLNPDGNDVQVSFYGLVSQETGEDWASAALTLSTAVPNRSMKFPKLLTWKIGVRDRFIPTPAPLMEQVRPPPPAPPVSQERNVAAERYAQVMGELNQRLGGAIGTGALAQALQAQTVPSGAARGGLSSAQQDQQMRAAQEQRIRAEQEYRRRAQAESRAVSRAPSRPSSAAAPSAAPPSIDVGSTTTGVNVSSDFVKNIAVSGQEPSMGVGLAPPPGYRPPPIDPNSPAGRAGGHDLFFQSARPERIESGEGAIKVALFSERWPVKLERKLFPAIAPYAFLVGELTSPAKQVMPSAMAQLFVGQDPAGTAELKLMAPGEKVSLPLGVDRAIKPIRNVELVQSEKGFLSKDDVGEYLVTIEIANPYRFPVPIRIHDQWPLQGNDKAEVTLGKVQPAASSQDDKKGVLEWALTLPPNGKTKVSFRYTLKRPKSWRMQQMQEVVQ